MVTFVVFLGKVPLHTSYYDLNISVVLDMDLEPKQVQHTHTMQKENITYMYKSQIANYCNEILPEKLWKMMFLFCWCDMTASSYI